MHLKRWITGIIALPILYLLVWVGGIVFYLLVAAASIITLWEYYRIVFETDGPFLTPEPHRGRRPNKPAYVRYVADRIAALHNMPLDEFAAQTTANAERLFNLTALA